MSKPFEKTLRGKLDKRRRDKLDRDAIKRFGVRDEDLWNIDHWFLSTLSCLLLNAADKYVGYPGTGKYEKYEDWISDLRKYGEIAKYLSDRWYSDIIFSDGSEDRKKFDSLFDWFKENFRDLWD